MDERTKNLVNKFEEMFGDPKYALHTLASSNEEVPIGVIEYWEEKLKEINHDVSVLRNKNEK